MAIAVQAIGFGGPENLSVVQIPDTDPRPGEVVIEVRAAGINPVDAKVYSGTFGIDPDRLPLPLGSEVSGVVRAVGPGAVGPAGPIRVGDEVIGFRVTGGYTDRLVAPGSAVLPKPASLSWEQAAGLMLAGVTAMHTLAATAVQSGETLLVHGGAGGVGLMVVQLATHRGARVIATARPARHDLLRELGAEPVTYGPGMADRVRAVTPSGADAAIDTVGTDEAIDVSVQTVVDRSRIATIAAFAYGGRQQVRRLGGGPGADPGTELRNAARLELIDLVDKGALQVLVAGRYPLAEAAHAHRDLAESHPPGKLVLVP